MPSIMKGEFINNMKPFNEFWSSISEDEMANIAEIAGNRAESVQTDDPKYMLGTKIGVISAMMTMQLLDRYHKWLCEQLDLPLDD